MQGNGQGFHRDAATGASRRPVLLQQWDAPETGRKRHRSRTESGPGSSSASDGGYEGPERSHFLHPLGPAFRPSFNHKSVYRR